MCENVLSFYHPTDFLPYLSMTKFRLRFGLVAFLCIAGGLWAEITGIELDNKTLEESTEVGTRVGTLIVNIDGKPALQLQEGLVAHYPFEGNTRDHSGLNNDGVLKGGSRLTEDRFGRSKQALFMDGAGDWMEVSGLADDLHSAFTVSAWVQASPANLGTRRTLLSANSSLSSTQDENSVLLMIGQRSTDDLLTKTFVAHDPITSNNQILHPVPVADGKWHHIVYSTSGRLATGYLDGEAGDETTVRYSFRGDLRWSIGQEFDEAEPSDFYKGLLDEVRIFNRALNAEEVQALYQEPTFRLVPGEGDTENAFFQIVSNQLTLVNPLNFEENSSPSIRILATGTNGQSFEQVVEVNVTDTNDAPVGITLSPSSVKENLKVGTVVGNLTAIDEDHRDSHTFELVSNPPSGFDNDKFSLTRTSLSTKAILDFEAQPEHPLLIRVIDGSGATFEQSVLVEVENQNDAPTEIELKGEPTEGPVGTVLGTLLATDIDPEDSHTFRIIGGIDKAFFKIDGTQLVAARALDYEMQTLYQVTIRAMDKAGAFVDRVLDVHIANANDAPTDILLEPNSVQENQPAKTLVGTFRQIDPDGEWTPVEDPGEPELFLHDEFNGDKIADEWIIEFTESTALNHTVSNGQLTVASIETEIHNTTAEGDWAMVTLTRDITRLADFEAAWKVAWDQNEAEETIQEMFLVLLGPNEELIAAVGIYDEWLRHRGVRFTSLPDNDYMTSIGSLAFADNEDTLKVVRWGNIVEVYWNTWLFATGESEVPLAKVQILFGDSPSTLNTISSKTGTSIVKDLKISGIEAPRAPSYKLVEGKGDEDNSLFTIEGNRLLTAQPFNFEESDTYSIRVRGIDPGDLSVEKTFDIQIQNTNDGPTGILIDKDSIAENQPRGTLIGYLQAWDEDVAETHRWQLLAPQDGGTPDNALFSLSGNALRTVSVFDFENKDSYTLDLRVTDSQGAIYDQQLTIGITDENDAPGDLVLSSMEVPENQPPGTEVARLTAVDQDALDKHTFQISGGKHAGFFNIKGDQLLTKTRIDFESTSVLDLRIRVSDSKKATFEKYLDIQVINGNDAPTGIELSNRFIPENQTPGSLVGTFQSIDPDIIVPLTLPLHFHNLQGWEVTLDGTPISNDFESTMFSDQLLPAINEYFAPANLKFTVGRVHDENLRDRLPPSPSEQASLQNKILNSKDPSEELVALMDPDMMETGSFHLYLFPFVGKSRTYLALPEHNSNNAIGLWTTDDSGDATRSDLNQAAIHAISASLGMEPTGTPLTTEQIRQARLQAVIGRPILEAETPAPFPSLRNVDFSKVAIADQQFHIQQSGSSGWVPYATTHSLTQPNTTVRRILLMTQGVDDSLPQAWNDIRQVLANEGQDERTLLIAPQFLRSDQLVGSVDETLLYWNNRKEQLFGGLSVARDGDGNNDDDLPEIEGTRIDKYEMSRNYPSRPEDGTSSLVRTLVSDLKETPSDFTFLHLTSPDSEGHGHGWGRSHYHDSIRAVDADLGLVLDLVENNAPYQGNTVLLLTADHGGGGDNLYQHTTPTEPLNFTIPFYAWGKGVLAGSELYELNPTARLNPDAETNPDYSANSATQPIRNGEIGNLAGSILGLPTIPGSWINQRQDLKVGSRTVRAKYVIAISVDGLRPLDIDQLGASELPNFYRLRNEGAYTHNARTDTFITRTLPNHTCMMTSRGTFDVAGTGNGHGQDLNTDNGKTIHDNNDTYVYSIFDMAKQKGLRTSLYANKSKFQLFYRTWDGTWEPPIGNNEPKPDTKVPQFSTSEVIDKLLDTFTQDERLYPNLEEIVLLGHGDGADLLQRYAIQNTKEPEILNRRQIPFRYLVISQDTFTANDINVPYPYGLDTRPYPYDQIATNVVSHYMNSRHLSFIIGETDDLTTDNSPAALQQGSSKHQRAHYYLSKLQGNAPSKSILIPQTGHNLSRLLQRPEAIYTILGKTLPDQDGDGWADQDEVALSSDPTDFFSTPGAILPTYRLVEGIGSEQNSLFKIESNRLFTNAILDFETLSNPSIRVKVTDPGGQSVESTFQLQVTDNNDSPTGISLSKTTLPENLPAKKWVSILLGEDQDRRDPLTYELVNPEEARFSIRGNQLISEQVFDFEVTPELEVAVRVTDNAGSHYEEVLTIAVEDQNEPSTDLALSTEEFAENQPSGTVIATISTEDPDQRDQFTYTLVNGDGSFDNPSFTISDDGKLLSNELFDYETKKTYFLRVRSVDFGGNVFEKALSIEILDQNDPPTALTLSNNSLEEDKPVGTIIGSLSTLDPDEGDTHTYTITENEFFGITGNQLVSTSTISRRDHTEIEVTIETTDENDGTLEKTFVIFITDAPDAPTDILLDNSDVPRFSRTGTLVGRLSTKDADAGDTHTFTLPTSSEHSANALFFIKENQLLTNHFFDETSGNQYTISVEVEDSSGNRLSEELSITITNADKPNGHLLEITKVPEDGGLVSGAGYYRNGENATIETIPSPGRHFSGHSGDVPGGISAETSLKFQITSSGTITSTFAQKYHKVLIEVYPELHGFVSGGGTYLHGSKVKAKATELPEGYNSMFTHWSVNGEIMGTGKDPLELEITADQELHILAHFDYGLDPSLKLVSAGSFNQSVKTETSPFVSSFYIQQYETTKKEWFEVFNWAIDNGYTFEFDPADPQQGRNLPHADPNYHDNWPITGITWMDAIKWTNARSEKEGLEPVYYTDQNHSEIVGKSELEEEFILQPNFVKWRAKGYRLPTDAEWEKAARGKLENQFYPNGNQIDDSFAHFNQRSAPINLSQVGQGREPNGYGLYDMAGNAWELCWDWYWKNWDRHVQDQLLDPEFLLMDPIGPTHEQVIADHRAVRSVRGGDANSDRFRTRVDYRRDLKTWSQYAITVRPIVPGPAEEVRKIEVHTDTPHLGTISGAGSYPGTGDIVLNAVPISGSSNFLRWEDENGAVLSTRQNFKVSPAKDGKYIAHFEAINPSHANLYSLQAEAWPNGEGYIDGSGAYIPGVEAILSATPTDGNAFAGWSGDASGIENTLKVKMNSDKFVQAFFGDTSIDSDRDGLSDLYENSIGSNSFSSDSDDDGLRDIDEVRVYGSDPTKTDTDGDGFDDRTEYIYGTPMNSAEDFPFFVTNALARYFLFKVKPFDYSGNRGHGTDFHLTPAEDRAGVGKNSFQFDGTQSYFEATGYAAPSANAARAFGLWVYRDNSLDASLLSYGSGAKAFSISVVDEHLVVDANNVQVSSTNILPANEWFQVIVSYREGAAIKDLKLMVNGINLETSILGDGTGTLDTGTSKALHLGKGPHGFFTGRIDDVRLWERYLAPSEAFKLYEDEVYREPSTLSPVIEKNPNHATVAYGETATFKVTATGKPAPTYQWQKVSSRNWVDIRGSTSASLEIVNVSDNDATNYRVLVENHEGTRVSAVVRLSVMEKPSILTTFNDIAFLPERGGNLNVDFDGSAPLTFEWFRNGESISKSTSNRLIIQKKSTQETHGGTYQVKVSNSVGEATSSEFQISLIEPVLIVSHPTSTKAVAGNVATLSVLATGGGTLIYQWEKYDTSLRKWEPVAEGTEADLTFESLNDSQAGRYRCTVTNGPSTLLSKYADIGIYVPPTFNLHPKSETPTANSQIVLHAEASGSPTPTYQWQKQDAVSGEWLDLPKMVRNTYSIKPLQPSDAGNYRCKASNSGGTTFSNEASIDVHYAPTLINTLESLTLNEGATLDLSIEAMALDSRGTDINYQWFLNKKQVQDGNNISGSSTSNLIVTNTEMSHQGTWYCQMSNLVGTTQTSPLKVVLVQKPTAVRSPFDVTTVVGKHVVLAASIRGGRPLTFQWSKDGALLDGATTSKLYLRSVTELDSGTYTLTVSNPAGSLELSSTVTITGDSNSRGNIPVTISDPLAAAMVDSDNDGLNDLLEYALGSHPDDAESTFAPRLDRVQYEDGDEWISFSYTESQSATGVAYVVETSSNLVDWEMLDLASTSIQRQNRGAFTEVTYYFPVTKKNSFYRVRIEK